MANNQDIKDFFALTGNNLEVTNPRLVRLQAYIDFTIGVSGSNADQLIDFLFDQLVERVLAFELSIAQDNVVKPTF